VARVVPPQLPAGRRVRQPDRILGAHPLVAPAGLQQAATRRREADLAVRLEVQQ
jgi:hypothetical protein